MSSGTESTEWWHALVCAIARHSRRACGWIGVTTTTSSSATWRWCMDAHDRLAVGDRVRMADWVTAQHLRVLGISETIWVERFLTHELVVVYPDDGVWRVCGRVVQVTPSSPGAWLPLNIKYCY